MRHAIRHHGVAVADAAGHVAVAGERRGGLLRTDRIERRLILLAGDGADLTGRAGLPHAPDLQARNPRFGPRSGRSGFAARAHRAQGAFRPYRPYRALKALWSCDTCLAARAGRPWWPFQSRHTLRALRP